MTTCPACPLSFGLKEHLAPNQEVILLSLSKDGTYRSLLCDEDLKASLAGVGARDRPASHAAQPPRRASGVPVEERSQPRPLWLAKTPERGAVPRPRRPVVTFGAVTELGETRTGLGVASPDEEDVMLQLKTDSTNLVEAMGLSEEYRQLRQRMRRQTDLVWKTLQEHRDVVSARARTGDSSRMKVHGRDLEKLRRTARLMQHLEDTAEESLLQKPVRALWRICRARQRLWQEDPRTRALRPRRRCWESSWQSLGPFAQLAFRLYASGDGDAAEGTSVIFFWMEKPPILSFSFIVTVGAEEVTMQTWSSEVAWARVELPLALLDQAAKDAQEAEQSLAIGLQLVQWHRGT